MTAPGRVAAGLIVVVFAVMHGNGAAAHSGLRFASPLEGSTLGAAPTHVQLTFIEHPEPSLSAIRVSDTNGQTFQIGEPELLSGDPLSLTIAVRELPRGVYVVNWRVVSAVDGHATAGAFAFGVLMAPTGPPPAVDTQSSNLLIEITGRSGFLIGLIITLGAATYQLLRLGDAPWIHFAGTGLLLAAAGLVVLIAAQWRAGDADLPALLGTSIGRAWIARAAAIALAIAGLALATAGSQAKRRSVVQLGAVMLWLATCGAIGVHAFSGHAAAGRLPVASTVAVHAIHVAAAGIWIGGLAVVIAGLRGSAENDQARALRRFSTMAVIGLALVTITGLARSIQEVGTWHDLTKDRYGLLVIAKVVLLLAIAALGGMNRWRHVATAVTDTRPLGRTARGEIAFAVLAIVTAGALSTLPPPAAAAVLPGIEVSGADFATTVKARLTAVSNQPGPNRFSVALEDYDSGDSISPNRVTLRFTPIDDPGVSATTLALSKDAEGVFTATGANVAFDGRWRVNVLMERGTNSVDVPLEFEAQGRPQRVSKVRVPGAPSVYRVEIGSVWVVHFSIDQEQPGERRLQISCFNGVTEPCGLRNVVITAENDTFPARPLPVTQPNRNQFTAPIRLEEGTNRIVIIARTESGDRVRAAFLLKVPNGG